MYKQITAKIKSTKQAGFTLMELMIVIVMLAILAAITFVAYRGTQARANDSARQSDATQMNRLIGLKALRTGTLSCSLTECASNDQFGQVYEAQKVMAQEAVFYQWVDIRATVSDIQFDKSKLVIINNSEPHTHQWIVVSYWSNADNAWISTQYNDDGTTLTAIDSVPRPTTTWALT